MIARLFAGKFRRPTGFLGRLVGNVMARGNAHEAGWTVSLLNIQPDQHILEIGFGPSVAIQSASQKAARGPWLELTTPKRWCKSPANATRPRSKPATRPPAW
jgi:hypothetical protein